MPRIDKDKLDLLVKNSTLSQEELLNYEIIQKEKQLICVTLSVKERKAYHKYCFNHKISQSEMSRKLLRKGITSYQDIFQKELLKPNPRSIHTFLIGKEEREDFHKEVLTRKENTQLLTESGFMRRCIVGFLEEMGVNL